MSNLPPNDVWARWRKPGGRRSTVTIVAIGPITTPILNLVGHQPGLVHVHEIWSEVGHEASLLGFWIPRMPQRLQRGLKVGQRFMVDLERKDDADGWEFSNWTAVGPSD